MQHTKTLRVHIEVAAGNQLAEHRAPLLLVQILADAPGRQLFMAPLTGFVVGLATQNIDDVIDTILLTAAIHR